MSQLEARHLAKRYGQREVVSDVSLTVGSGEVVGLLGPNGAGKTTSFYMIVGLVKADRGSVSIGDQDLTKSPMHVRARAGLGYLPQEPSVFRKLNVYDNVMAILQTRADLDRIEQRRQAEHLLGELEIGHLKETRGEALSGGERRRLEIARALASRPQFILLDEPFAGVDPISVDGIRRIVTFLRDQGIGVLITDHSVREALSICNRGYIVNEGHIISEGSPSAIAADTRVREVYLGHEFSL